MAKKTPEKSKSVRAVEARNLKTAKRAAAICDEKRAEDILVLDLRKVCDFTDYFVIATASSGPQMRGISREMERALRDDGAKLLSKNGADDGKWSVLDFGDVVVHLFDQESRDFYQLEMLWGDAKRVKL